MLWLRKSKKGFTLIELMVVVAIIAVLSLLGLRVYTGQATKARNASVQANIHSLSTELGVIILGSSNPGFNTTEIQTAADNAQITNPFDTTKGGSEILIGSDSSTPLAEASTGNTPGQIYYSNVNADGTGATAPAGVAYKLQGIGHDGTILIDLNVNYAE